MNQKLICKDGIWQVEITSKLIDVNKLKNKILTYRGEDYISGDEFEDGVTFAYNEVLDMVNEKYVDELIPKAHISKIYRFGLPVYICTRCRIDLYSVVKEAKTKIKYCPYCGAKIVRNSIYEDY